MIRTKKISSADSQGPKGAVPAHINPKQLFFFAISPKGWDWDEELQEFLPRLKRQVIDPGVNGVGENMDPLPAVLAFQARGWIFILEGDPKLPEQWREFWHEAPHTGNNGKARFVLSIFESVPEVVGSEVFIEVDTKALREFKLWLVKEYPGVELKPAVRRLLIREQGKRVERLANRVAKNPMNQVTARKLVEQAKKLCAMKGELFNYGDYIGLPDAPPAPPKKAAKKKDEG